MNITFLYSS